MKLQRVIGTILALAAVTALLGQFYYFSQPKLDFKHAHMKPEWLAGCQPNEIRTLWAPEFGWMARATIDIQKRSLLGGAGNGISNVAPYLNASPDGQPLSDQQISRVRTLLSQLPPGLDATTDDTNFTDNFHIAYFHNGVLLIRHYPESSLPPAIIEMGHVLKVFFVKWGDPGDPPHLEIHK